VGINSSVLTNFGRRAGEHHGANSLAVERELMQLDTILFNADTQFFARFWSVYEPPRQWEASNVADRIWFMIEAGRKYLARMTFARPTRNQPPAADLVRWQSI
jgi:hypothetical protein